MIIIICQEMKWTFGEFLAQPTWFIDYLQIKMSADAKHSNKKLNESNGRQ